MSILFIVPAINAENGTLFKTDKLDFVFQSENSSIVQWLVHTGNDKKQWKSLLTRENSGKLFSKHLSLDGISLGNGRWEISKEKEEIVYTGFADNGRLAVRKKFKTANDYRFVLQIEIENISSELVEIKDNVRLVLGPGLGEYPVEGFGIAENMYSYVEAVVSSGSKIIKINKDFLSQPSSLLQYEWIGLHSRYFALLLTPLNGYAISATDIDFYLTHDAVGSLPDRYLPKLSVSLNIRRLNPSQIVKRDFLIFSGPKSTKALKSSDFDFSSILFSGIWTWMAVLCSGMLWILKIIYEYVSNWGLSIILFAVLVRIVMYPFARKALSSQKDFARIQKIIQPELHAIKEKYRGGEQSERILELYKHYGVSPLAGLKPLLIVLVQLPIFVALFHVLGRAFELRSASFLWIDTLAEPDRLFNLGLNLPFFGEYFNVLPVFMAVTTLLTIKLSPAPVADSSRRLGQNIFLIIVSIGFFILFYTFPSGMVLYWTMANILHLLQQLIVERKER